MDPVRVTVPNDNSCLFYAVARLCEPTDEARAVTREKQLELRTIVANRALADPDRDTRSLIVGQPVEEYAKWITDEFHWGGEHEVVCLSEHYGVSICVVSAESMLTYGDGATTCYLLYTGTHYDPLTGGAGAGACGEVRLFPGGAGAAFEAKCTALAAEDQARKAKRAASERVYRIKCCGCGAKLEDASAFERHCADVDHGDDFAYDCEDIFDVEYDE